MLAKETRWNKIDEEITRVKERLAKITQENKQLTGEVKNLKKMLPKQSLNVRNSPEKPLFAQQEKDAFLQDQHFVMGDSGQTSGYAHL